MKNSIHPIIALSSKYPQLCLPLGEDVKDSELYKRAVLRGEDCGMTPDFSLNEEDFLETIDTPAGPAEILFLKDRADFEHAVRALGHRCAPVDVPKSMGASAIRGLINWDKLHAHAEDFDSFIADKNNYLDSLILLSWGEYSAVPAERTGMSEEDWLEKSLTVRKFHELTHFISGRLFPENREAIRDEVMADMIGIVSALGIYDTKLAKCFLGTEGETYRPGGRLENYTDAPAQMGRVNALIDLLEAELQKLPKMHAFALLEQLESNRIGI